MVLDTTDSERSETSTSPHTLTIYPSMASTFNRTFNYLLSPNRSTTITTFLTSSLGTSAHTSSVVTSVVTSAVTLNCSSVDGCVAGIKPARATRERLAIGLVLTLIVLLTLAGNSLIMLAVARFRHMRSHTNLFVVSLASADLLVGAFVMPIALYQQLSDHVWHLGDTFCLITSSCDVMFTTTSIFHLCCLATDRYLAICKPFFYCDKVTRKAVILAIVTCWVVPMFISFLPILNRWNERGLDAIIILQPKRSCTFIVNLHFAIICSTIAFFIPIVYLAWSNVKIYLVAKKQAKQIRIVSLISSLPLAGPGNRAHMQRHQKRKKYIKTETKAAKTIVIIMGAFTICWLPFFTLNIIDPFIGYKISYYPWMIVLWLGYSNSMLNPFFFYFFNRKFREVFQTMLPFVRKRRLRREQELSASRRATVYSHRGSDDRHDVSLLQSNDTLNQSTKDLHQTHRHHATNGHHIHNPHKEMPTNVHQMHRHKPTNGLQIHRPPTTNAQQVTNKQQVPKDQKRNNNGELDSKYLQVWSYC